MEGGEDRARHNAVDVSIEGVGLPRRVGISPCLLSPLQRTLFSAASWPAKCQNLTSAPCRSAYVAILSTSISSISSLST